MHPVGTIWHVVGSMDPSRGGTTAAVAEIASRLASRGHPTRVLAGAVAAAIHSDLAQWDRLRTAGARLDIEAASGIPLRSPGLTKLISQSIKPGDVVHLHGVWEGLLWDAAKVAERAQVRYMVCPHGMLDRWSRTRSRLKKTLAWNLGARHFIRRAGAIHFAYLTEHDRVETQEVCSPAPVRIIPTGVDPAAFAVRDARTPSGRPLEVLYLGRIHPKKGLDVLLNALAVMRAPAQLKIAGPSDDSAFENRCRAIVNDRGLTSRVQWLGPLLGDKKVAAFHASDVFILPSWQEGLRSIAVLEAMACALPVILSEHCHFPEVAHHAAGIIVDNQAQAVAEALNRLAAMDESARAAMGMAGRRLVEKSYSWDSIVDQLDMAYRDLGYEDGSNGAQSNEASLALKSAADASRCMSEAAAGLRKSAQSHQPIGTCRLVIRLVLSLPAIAQHPPRLAQIPSAALWRAHRRRSSSLSPLQDLGALESHHGPAQLPGERRRLLLRRADTIGSLRPGFPVQLSVRGDARLSESRIPAGSEAHRHSRSRMDCRGSLHRSRCGNRWRRRGMWSPVRRNAQRRTLDRLRRKPRPAPEAAQNAGFHVRRLVK